MNLTLAGEVKSITFVKGGGTYKVEIELLQTYGEGGFRSLGSFVVYVDHETAMELAIEHDAKHLKVDLSLDDSGVRVRSSGHSASS